MSDVRMPLQPWAASGSPNTAEPADSIDAGRPDSTLSQPKVYRASFAKILPSLALEAVSASKSCLAISLENQNFTTPKLAAMLDLIDTHFSECALYVSDYLYRLTLKVTAGLDEPTALRCALAIGDDFIRQNRHLIVERPKFAFVKCSEKFGKEEVIYVYSILKDLYRSSPRFRASVEVFAKIYQDRVQKPSTDAFQCAVQYLLEELALFSCLTRSGRNVIVYPGNISTVSDIAQGLCEEVNDLFPNLVFASIRFSSRRSSHE